MGTEPGNEAYWRTRVGMLRAAAKDKGPCEGAMLMAGTLAEIADVLEAGLDRAPTDSHIARALALLNRVGDVAADAILKGEAAVVRDDEVPMPRNADQAAGMTFLGHRWLQQHAPDRLTAAGRLDREGE
jgi:hypothetical protein